MTVASSHGFVGRGEELARLLAALERAEQGRPAMVLVAGDAGVGKTRLLAELADQARQRGAQVLVGGCVELGDIGLAYLPVVDALHELTEDPADAELLAEVVTTAPGIRRLLAPATVPASAGVQDDGLNQLQVFGGVRALLVSRAERSPIVLVLEDLHWADGATRDLLAFLARTLRSGRVMLVMSYRSDELHRRHPLRPLLAELLRLPEVERLELAPFSRAELAQQLEAITGSPLPVDQLERIHARSEGNPFYAEQLLAAGADVGLPSTLADVLLARIQALSGSAQQVLRVAAVAGRGVPHWLLAEVAGWPEVELEQGLREAIEAGVLVTDTTVGAYAFRHALLQEAVYGDLLPSEQVRLHAAYARVLASQPDGVAAELAHHCLASNDLAGALAASVRAADEAAMVLAPAETLRHLTTALKLWERVPDPAGIAGADRTELTVRAAAGASTAGDRSRAILLAQEAAATADATADPAGAARGYERLGQYLLDAGRIQDGLRARARAVELVPAHPPTPLRVRVVAAMAQALINAGQRDEARRWCEGALALAQTVGSAEDEADALITLGLIEYNDPAKARSLYVAARVRAADAGKLGIESRALQDLAWLEFGLGNLASARVVFDEGAELAQRTGLGWSHFGIIMRRGQQLVRYEAGDWDDCQRLAANIQELVTTPAVAELAAAALYVAVGCGQRTAIGRLGQLAALASPNTYIDMEVAGLEADHAAWQGNLEQARAAVQRGLAVFDGAEFEAAQIWVVPWICAIGLAVEAGRAGHARATGDPVVLADAIAAGQELLTRARTAVQRAAGSAYAHDVYPVACLAKAEAEWTRLQGRSDPKAWQAAVAAFSYGHLYEMARCRWRLAEALLDVGDREQATMEARVAYEAAVQLGAEPLRAVLEALARRGRLDLGLATKPEPTAAGLTPREQEVLRLLVAGKSNRQIAEQLFISGKTVSVHVTNILAKLGVHSRLEAAARARELGLDRLVDSRQR